MTKANKLIRLGLGFCGGFGKQAHAIGARLKSRDRERQIVDLFNLRQLGKFLMTEEAKRLFFFRHVRYFLAAFLGLGVNGSGGLLSNERSSASVRLLASPAGRKSSLAISAARCAGVSCLVMVGV